MERELEFESRKQSEELRASFNNHDPSPLAAHKRKPCFVHGCTSAVRLRAEVTAWLRVRMRSLCMELMKGAHREDFLLEVNIETMGGLTLERGVSVFSAECHRTIVFLYAVTRYLGKEFQREVLNFDSDIHKAGIHMKLTVL